MKRFVLPILLAAALPAADSRITTAMNAFTTASYKQLMGGDANLILSPFNVATALSMALAGARGRVPACVELRDGCASLDSLTNLDEELHDAARSIRRELGSLVGRQDSCERDLSRNVFLFSDYGLDVHSRRGWLGRVAGGSPAAREREEKKNHVARSNAHRVLSPRNCAVSTRSDAREKARSASA